jgi:hypothetical protein
LGIIVLPALSQSTFSLFLSNENNELPAGILELNNGNYILSYNSAAPSEYFDQNFMLIDANGQLISSWKLTDPSGSCGIGEMYQINDSTIVGVGTFNNGFQNSDIWLVGMDNQLNKKWEKKYRTQNLYSISIHSIMESDSTFTVASTMQNEYHGQNTFLFLKINSEGDSITSKSLTNLSWGSMLFDIQKTDKNSNYELPVKGFESYTNSQGQILILDSLFNFLQVDSIPEGVGNCCSLKNDTDTTSLISGNYYVPFSDLGTDIALMRLDKNNFNMGIAVFGKSGDTNDYGGYFRSLDYMVKSNIYVGGTSNQSLLGNFSNSNSWYILSCFDSLLNLKWTKYYGGDAYYSLNGIKATEDHGCIMYGCRYDYFTQVQEQDVLVIKVNDEGLYTGLDENKLVQGHDAVLYPNPGMNFFEISFGVQINGALFYLNDLQGHQLIECTLSNSHAKINTSSLHPGTYTWNIVSKRKILESGKWIKE